MKALQELYKDAFYYFNCISRVEHKIYRYRYHYPQFLNEVKRMREEMRDRIDLISKEIGDDFITCPICGERENIRGLWGKDRIERFESGLCHTCDYWTERIKFKDEPWSIRIDGKQYIDGGKSDSPKDWKGLGGDAHIFRRLGGKLREYIVTDNLWVNGEIPERFKSQLPDNAEQVDFHDFKERRRVLDSLL